MNNGDYLNTLNNSDKRWALLDRKPTETWLDWLNAPHTMSEEEDVRKRIEKLYIKEAGK